MITQAVIIALVAVVIPVHDSSGSTAFRSPAHAWCCSANNDCFTVPGVKETSLPTIGYRLPSGEFVPMSETLPSLDGQFWRCQHPDGKRRCFFVPPNGS